MARVTEKQVAQLRKFLVGQKPSSKGEWYMRCPLHKDKTRSASLNMKTGEWYCHACAIGGGAKQLIDMGSPDGNGGDSPFEYDNDDEEKGTLSYGEVKGYASALSADRKALRKLVGRRGLDPEILGDYDIGWDAGQDAYTIPIFDQNGEVVNIRRYQLDPTDDRRKIWSVKGYGSPDLYPMDQLENDTLIICEGEWDALATIQAGYPAITRTGAAKVWKSKWNHWFKGKTVYIIHDMDEAGQHGNKIVYNELKDIASCHVVRLPYEIVPKHGKDLSDYWEDHDLQDLIELIDEQTQEVQEIDVVEPEVRDVTINESLLLEDRGVRIGMTATIGGRSGNFFAPRVAEFECSMNFGQKCDLCPMNDLGGEMSIEVPPDDEGIIGVVKNTTEFRDKFLMSKAGIVPSCKVVRIKVPKRYHVTQVNIRPNIDDFDEERSTVSNRNVLVIDGAHGDDLNNSTVRLEGAIYEHPKDQSNVFLADRIHKVQTSIDMFEMTDEMYARLEKFQSVDPLDKMYEIADDLSANVTGIYHRPEMHIFMDLIFHSVISWPFNNRIENKGWLDAIVAGDTRTGKSETAIRLQGHYRVGEMTTAENSSFAGLVGGAEKVFEDQWGISWGLLPMNDRRMVILDEVSDMSKEDIGKMSSVRSSGEASITKIAGGKAMARTRLLWLSNPRDGYEVSRFNHAYEVIKILMAQSEDIARFDMAMVVGMHDVKDSDINVMADRQDPVYDARSCQDLIGWAWSRTRDQVQWEPEVEEYIITTLAIRMGRRYSSRPLPLVQAANIRMKLARIAVAMAARTFNHHPDDDEILYVQKAHADAAYDFLDTLYSDLSFGYLTATNDMKRRQRAAKQHAAVVIAMLKRNAAVAHFLKSRQSTFSETDWERVQGRGNVVPEAHSMMEWGMFELTAKGAFTSSADLRTILGEL